MAKLVLLVALVYFINGVTSESSCLTNKYGPSCQYECHCSGGTFCNRERGCWGSCDKGNGWDGPTCQRKNVVLKRRSVHEGPEVYKDGNDILYHAGLVVDGKTGQMFSSKTCALAWEEGDRHDRTVKAWWNVTLDEEYYISRFTMYNRRDTARRRNNGFILSVGNSSVPGFDYKDCYRDNYTQNGDPPLILERTCINNTPLKGDVIQIRQTTYRALQICELIVYVCAAGWYGEDCNRMCTTETKCFRCDVGQISCKECVPGRWGEYCLEACNCLGGVSCNKVTGMCPGDNCAAGYEGEACNKTCRPGTYGPDCSSTCGSCYDIYRSCNITDGYCPESVYRCQRGYLGLTCHEKCPNGNWGFECSQSCGNCRGDNVCNKTNGICPKITGNRRCKPGYLESDYSCNRACDDGKWGDNCGFTCSENCIGSPCAKENGACPDGGCLRGYTGDKCDNECSAGSWGYNCNETCSMNCLNGYASCSRLNGTCVEGCVKGFEGERCEECSAGSWGYNCNETCSMNCLNGYASCSRLNGTCVEGCVKGFKGERCQECSAGSWGYHCNETCSMNCLNGYASCSRLNGTCVEGCVKGFKGERCQECSAGSWGYNCNETCSMNCLNGYASCSRPTGTCVEGCVKGFKGERCHLQTGTPGSPTGSPSAGLIGGIVGGVIVVIIIVVVVVILRRRKQQTEPSQGVSLSLNSEASTRLSISPNSSGVVYQNMEQGPTPKLHPKPIATDSSGHDNNALQSDNNSTVDTYMNHNVTSASISVENFWEHVGKKKADNKFKVDFAKFPVGPQLKHDVAVRPENKKKNRYKDLVAYDHSRVVLNPMEGNMSTDYINACYINGFDKPKRYIASQGPTELIINDFMRMIFEQNTGTIVMLTNLFEDSKVKCLKYWPEISETVPFGVIEVKLHRQEQFADFVVRELSLTHLKTNKTNMVKQFHFTSWPDHGVPTHADGLLYFRDKVNNCDSKLQRPIVVHCSAGVGRTGTYIALDYLLQEAQALGSVDVTGCVNRLREQRINMIQSEAQYVFLHEALVEALRLTGSSISSVDFTTVYKELSTVNPKTGKNRLAEQFEDICSATPVPSNTDRARDPVNIDKNRYRQILPDEDCRPYITTPVSGGTDYINAVFLPAYKTKRGFIITQMPLTNTVVDFWRLVYDHSVNTIVMLNTEEDYDDSVGVYWTDDSQKFGPFDVTVTNKDMTRDDFHIWTYSLKYKGMDEGISVKQYRCKFWSDTMSQKSIGSALILIDQILPTLGKNPIVAHCMNGFIRSGLFCTSCAVIEKIKMDFDVNILQTVKKMRVQRPEIITDLEQYDFLHKIVLGYLEAFQLYANFQ